MKKVYVGVGHGGDDPGACANGFKEKDLNLDVALACHEHLVASGVNSIISRTNDTFDSIKDKCDEANALNVDLVLDVHHNAGGGDGAEALHTYKGGTGKTMAQNILNEVVAIGQNSRGCKTRLNENGDDYYGMIRDTNAPAVIVECAFVDNSKDIQEVDTEAERKEMGIAIAKGVLKTLGISPSGTTPPSQPSTPPTSSSTQYYPKCSQNQGSYVDGLKEIKVDSSMDHRKKIGAKNGLPNYSGTSSENEKCLSLLKQGKLVRSDSSASAPVQPTTAYYPKCSSSQTSYVDGLKEIKVDSSFAHREKIGAKNGIPNYSGTASENEKCLSLLKQGKLIKA